MSVLDRIEAILTEQHNYIIYYNKKDQLIPLTKVTDDDIDEWLHKDKDNLVKYPNVIVRRDDNEWVHYSDDPNNKGYVGDFVDGEKKEGKAGYVQIDGGSDFDEKYGDKVRK